MSQWWGEKGLYRVTENHSDLRPGGKWSSADGKPFSVDGEYLEIDRPRLLVYTWNPKFRPPAEDQGCAVSLNRATACITRARTASAPAPWSRSVMKVSLAIYSRPKATA